MEVRDFMYSDEIEEDTLDNVQTAEDFLRKVKDLVEKIQNSKKNCVNPQEEPAKLVPDFYDCDYYQKSPLLEESIKWHQPKRFLPEDQPAKYCSCRELIKIEMIKKTGKNAFNEEPSGQASGSLSPPSSSIGELQMYQHFQAAMQGNTMSPMIAQVVANPQNYSLMMPGMGNSQQYAQWYNNFSNAQFPIYQPMLQSTNMFQYPPPTHVPQLNSSSQMRPQFQNTHLRQNCSTMPRPINRDPRLNRKHPRLEPISNQNDIKTEQPSSKLKQKESTSVTDETRVTHDKFVIVGPFGKNKESYETKSSRQNIEQKSLEVALPIEKPSSSVKITQTSSTFAVIESNPPSTINEKKSPETHIDDQPSLQNVLAETESMEAILAFIKKEPELDIPFELSDESLPNSNVKR